MIWYVHAVLLSPIVRLHAHSYLQTIGLGWENSVMSNKAKKDVITIAKPHTVLKVEIIEKYVDEWARKILGFIAKKQIQGSRGVVFIDCMSNCGLYWDEQGNLIEGTALRVAKLLDTIIQDYPEQSAILLFNDIDKDRIELLEQEINKRNLTHITVSYGQKDCNTFLKGIDSSVYQNHNTLMLYDPYKAAIDWAAVEPFLNRWGEVIINHMVSDTPRGAAQAQKTEVIERYKETYQQDIASIIQIGSDKAKLNQIILDIINKKTTCPYKQYIASFPFFTRTNGLLYNLVFCTFSIDGIKLFKEKCWKVFGNKSSSKNTHGMEMQYTLGGEDGNLFQTDEECYYVHDIAQYIFGKYHHRGEVPLNEIYDDLDQHPIFPSDGYKNEIKANLKQMFGVSFPKGQNKSVFSS